MDRSETDVNDPKLARSINLRPRMSVQLKPTNRPANHGDCTRSRNERYPRAHAALTPRDPPPFNSSRFWRENGRLFPQVGFLRRERQEYLLQPPCLPALVPQFIRCADGNQSPLMNDTNAVSKFFRDTELVS